MKKTKQILSVLLAVVMIVLSVPFAVAEGTTYRVGDQIQFGTYPQTLVTDKNMIANLTAEKKIWRSYDYFSGIYDPSQTNHSLSEEDAFILAKKSDYMKYADFFCNGEKYRAVKFSTYRPFSTYYMSMNSDSAGQYNGSYQDENGYTPNNVYFFKYEPLTWRILSPTNGFVLCENIIDAQAFLNVFGFFDDGNGHKGYYHSSSMNTPANDYNSSSIRLWLNADFYETAFSGYQKSKINGGIVLLGLGTVLESKYGFSSSNRAQDEKRQAKGTDYAKCQGLSVYQGYKGKSSWLLGTSTGVDYGAGSGDTMKVNIVRYDGQLYSPSIFFSASANSISGIRPACYLNDLEDNTVTSPDLFSCTHENTETHEKIEPTCKDVGCEEYEICLDCGKVLSGENREIPITDSHTPGEAVKENEIVATEEHGGSFDEVVYCAVCGSELSRVSKTTDPLTPEEPVTEPATEPATEPSDNGSGAKLNFFQRLLQWILNLFRRLFGR